MHKIKERFTNARTFLREHRPMVVTMAATGVMMLPVSAYAAPAGSNTTINKQIVSVLNSVVRPIVIAMGVIIAVFGLIQLILSFLQDRPEQKAQAGQMLIVGIVLTMFGALMAALLKAFGLS